MQTPEAIIEHVVGLEGGFVDDPSDSGGATKFGITERVARKSGYLGNMRDLTKAQAIQIYRTRYWKPLRLDEIIQTSPKIAAELFDTGVNAGTGRAAEFFQRCLNVLNRGGTDYADIIVDGDIGPATLTAYDAYRRASTATGETVMLKALNCLQGAFYIKLAERREKDERFLFGWLNHRVEL